MDNLTGKIAAVTGGASGIGRSLVKELLAAGATVVVGDVEQKALDGLLAEFKGAGDLQGVVTDVSDVESVNAFADYVFEHCGACHLLFNNAGVAAPSANVWETTPNDWTWVHSVNVMGVVHGIQAFVPRMIASGEEGHVINTSSGDGGVSPLPYQSVYASSKAAVSCITECLAAQLQTEDTALAASIFIPPAVCSIQGYGLPTEIDQKAWPVKSPTILCRPCRISKAAAAAGMDLPVQDLDELARFCLQGILDRRFVIMIGLEDAQATLEDRAVRIGNAVLPIDLATVPQL